MWEKIVLNLLSNAFKFTFEGEIAVALGERGGVVHLTVRDTGTGIPSQELPRLFDRFHRVEGAQGRSFEGSGIGLALVQELVKLHGGDISVDSEVGRGTTFTVTVPLGAAHLPDGRIDTSTGDRSTSTRAKTFVEEALRWLPGLMALLDYATRLRVVPLTGIGAGQGWGGGAGDLVLHRRRQCRHTRLCPPCWTRGAIRRPGRPDGEPALAAAEGENPDLILTDVMMPRLDGFGLIRGVRGDPDSA